MENYVRRILTNKSDSSVGKYLYRLEAFKGNGKV